MSTETAMTIITIQVTIISGLIVFATIYSLYFNYHRIKQIVEDIVREKVTKSNTQTLAIGNYLLSIIEYTEKHYEASIRLAETALKKFERIDNSDMIDKCKNQIDKCKKRIQTPNG